jgi:hypothetical protein
MKGVFNSVPSGPMYYFTWDVTVVLMFLKTLYPLESLTLKLLTLKVKALIALTAAPRTQTLVAMQYHDNCLFLLYYFFIIFNNITKLVSGIWF